MLIDRGLIEWLLLLLSLVPSKYKSNGSNVAPYIIT